jgi:hypothetical protein
MKALDNQMGPVKRPIRKSWQCLKDTDRFHMEAFGEEWFRDLMAHMPELEEKTNMSMAEYAKRLETKGKGRRRHLKPVRIHEIRHGARWRMKKQRESDILASAFAPILS